MNFLQLDDLQLFSQQFSKRIANENVIWKLRHVHGLQNGQFAARAAKAAKDEKSRQKIDADLYR